MSTERVGIEIELMGYEAAYRNMENLEREIAGLRGKKARIEVEARVDKLKKNLVALRSEMAKLKTAQSEVEKGGSAWNEQASRIRKVQNEIRETTAEMQRLQNALRNVKQVDLGRTFNSLSSKVGHIGSAMQSAGNALTRATAPLRMLTGGLGLGAAFSAVNKATEGLATGFERYDIMKKYPKMMAQFETQTYKATDSINELNDSVLGMPTGLDEIVDLSQRFTMTMGDMKKGTKLAIATNNAFLASMSTDTQKYQGMMQLQDVIGGKKMNAREWQSLANSMMPAIRMMGEEMGLAGDELNEWVSAVQKGKVSNEDFLKALEKAGTGEGKVASMAENAKDTWEAFSNNVQNAFSRMTYGLLQTADTLTQEMFGKDLNQLLSDVVPKKIDALTKKMQDWIKANPDKITDFFEKLKGIDWKGLGKGFVDGIGLLVKGIDKLTEFAEGKSLEKVGKVMALLAPIGSGLTILGGLIKGSRHIFAGIGTGLRALFTGGVIGKIAGIFKQLGGVGKAAEKAKKVGKVGKLGSTFKSFLPAIEGIAAVGVMLTEVSGIAALDSWLLSKAVGNVNKILDGMSDVFSKVGGLKSGWDSAKEGNLKTAVNDLFSIYDIIYGEDKTVMGAKANTKGAAGGTVRSKGLAQFKKGALKDMADSVKSLGDIFGEMIGINESLGKLKGFKGFDDKTVEGVGAFVESIGGIYSDLDEKLKDIKPTKADGYTQIISTSGEMFKSIGDIAKTLPDILKSLAPVTTSSIGGGGNTVTKIKDALTGKQGLFTTINAILSSVQNDLMGDGMDATGERFTAKGIGKLETVMASITAVFGSIKDVISQLPDIQASLTPLTQSGTGGSALTSITQMVERLMKGIGQMVTAVDGIGDTKGIETKVEQVKGAIGKIKSIASTLSELGTGSLATADGAAFTAIENIKAMVTQLGNALNTDVIAGIQAQVDAFTNSVNAMFEGLNRAFSNVTITINIKGKIKGADQLISSIRSVNNRIRMAVNGINTTYTRHVTVNISRSVNLTGTDPSTVNAGGRNLTPSSPLLHPSKGGAIYRASGGSIFTRRGTDTVPAMLTPGEFVQRRKAVQTFGLDFMRRVNALDIQGAMRSLSARVGRTSAVARQTTIYNNTTNNYNVNTNQNIRTNNPNFAFKRSNRYVNAL